jgi:hypothetical protein
MVPKLSIYTMFTAVAEEFMGCGMVYLLAYDGYNYLHSRGYEFFYGRTSSIKSFAILLKLGARVTSEVTMKEIADDLTLSFVRFEIKDHVKMRDGLERTIAKMEA